MKKLIRTIEELRPIDDTFMKKLGENRGVCKELLQTVLGNPDLEVLENTTQKNIHNIDTRSVTVDILCKENVLKICRMSI